MAPKGTDPRLVLGASPVSGLTGAGLLRAVLLGCVVGLLLGSHPLASWAARLPDKAEPVRAAAAGWDAAMARAGLSAPYLAAHRWARGIAGEP